MRIDKAPTLAAPWTKRTLSTTESGNGSVQTNSRTPSETASTPSTLRLAPVRSASQHKIGAPIAAPSMFTLKKAWIPPS